MKKQPPPKTTVRKNKKIKVWTVSSETSRIGTAFEPHYGALAIFRTRHEADMFRWKVLNQFDSKKNKIFPITISLPQSHR